MQRLMGDQYVPLPCDEDVSITFITEILHEEEDPATHPPGVPEPFYEDFRQGSFAWSTEKEAFAERPWPMGPMSSLSQGRIWPVIFLFKKGFYLVTAVCLEKAKELRQDQVRVLDLPEVTTAFAVLEDICDFIPANLSISDVAGISELQYYIRSAIPFGSPVNTNYHLLRMVRHGFPNKEEEQQQRSPAWKPYLYKGKSKLTISIVETVNCTIYGKPEYEDECFLLGTVYCCADVGGLPEVCVPIQCRTEGTTDSKSPSLGPDISVHNCAHVVGGVRGAAAGKEETLKLSCMPPTGPFVLCRYRFAQSPVMPVQGFYQIKEMSPVEFRLLLQIMIHPLVGGTGWNCQIRLPFHHRGVIKTHDLKCTAGSFSLTDQNQSILWNLNVRRPRGHLEANLLGELIFEFPEPAADGTGDAGVSGAVTTSPALAGPAATSVTSPTAAATQASAPAAASAPPASVSSSLSPTATSGMPAGPTVIGTDGMVVPAASSTSVGSGVSAPSRIATWGGRQPSAPRQATTLGAGPLVGGRSSVGTTLLGSALTPAAEKTAYEQSQALEALVAAGGLGGTSPTREGETTRGLPGGLGRSLFLERGSEPGPPPSEPNAKEEVAERAASEEKGTVAPATSGVASSVTPGKAPAGTGLPPTSVSPGGYMRDPFLTGVNCYAEVFLEVPDATLSGIIIDPKAVTVYPTSRIYGGVTVQKEVLAGKYTIWNMAGEIRSHLNNLEFQDDLPAPDPS